MILRDYADPFVDSVSGLVLLHRRYSRSGLLGDQFHGSIRLLLAIRRDSHERYLRYCN